MKSKFKRYLKIMVILSIMILATISFINMANETQAKAMIPRVSVYDKFGNQYIPCEYFPYLLTVTYEPINTPPQLGFPVDWCVLAYTQAHDGVVGTSNSLLINGKITWEQPLVEYVGGDAIPLNAPYSELPAYQVDGDRGAPAKLTQYDGQPLGVTLADNMLYVEFDSGGLGSIFAVNPLTGKPVWYASGLASYAMGNPIVYHGMVFVTVGDVGFTFSAIASLLANEPQKVFRGMGYGAIYAFNAQNGQLIWMMYTKGELMPSPAVYGNELVFATGNGTIEAVNPYDGEELWQDNLQGFIDSMSSLDYYILPNGIPVFIAGFTLLQQPYGVVVAVNGENGDILWISTPTDWSIYDTSGGDGPVAVDQQSGIVVQENVANESNNYVYTIVTAYNASNGDELWTTPIGYGYLPVAFKSAVPYIDNGIVYITSPSTASVTALNITNGNVIWNTSLTSYVKPASPDTPGAPRGAPVIYDGYLWLTAGPYVLALNPSNGQIEDYDDIGGGFGITNPVIAGSTMFLANSFGWTIAIPLQDIVPSLQ